MTIKKTIYPTADKTAFNICGVPTYRSVQDWANNTQSSGWISGGEFTDNANGTVSVAAGTGIIKKTDSALGEDCFIDWEESLNIALTENTTNYIFVDYNSGTPIIDVTLTQSDVNGFTKIGLGQIFREGNLLHVVRAGMVINDIPNRILRRFNAIDGNITRASGFVIGAKDLAGDTRYLTSTDGLLFAGYTPINTTGIDTTTADTFEYYYRSATPGEWIETDVSVIDNQNWDDGTGTLNDLTAQRYGVHWVYGDNDGHLMVLYGQGDYLLSQAEDATPPNSLPNHVEQFGFLAAKIIIQKSSTTFQSLLSAYDTQFNAAGAPVHNELSGLQGGTADEYYHLTNTEESGDWTGKDFLADTVSITSANGASPGGDAENVGTFTSGDGADGVEVVGGDIVTNGGFDTDSDWVHSGTTISGGKLRFSNLIDSASQTIVGLKASTKYKITWTTDSITSTPPAAAIRFTLGSTLGTKTSGTGSKTDYITTTDTGDLVITLVCLGTICPPGTYTAIMDDVVIEEVTQEGDAGDGGDMVLTFGSGGTPDGEGTSARVGGLFVNTFLDVPLINGLTDLSLSNDLTVGNDLFVNNDATITGNLQVEKIGIVTAPVSNIGLKYQDAFGAITDSQIGLYSDIQQNVDAGNANSYQSVIGSVQVDDATNKHTLLAGGHFSVFSFGVGGATEIAGVTSQIGDAANVDDVYIFKGENEGLGFFGAATNLYGLYLPDVTSAIATNRFGIVLDSDDTGMGSIWFGAGQDSKIWYDGTDMNIDPKVEGSGNLNILGDVDMGTNDITNATNITADAITVENINADIGLGINTNGNIVIDTNGNIVHIDNDLNVANNGDFGGDLTTTGDITTVNLTVLDGLTSPYKFSDITGIPTRSAVAFQNQVSGKNAIFELYSQDGDGTDISGYRAYGVGTPASNSNVEFVEMRTNPAGYMEVYSSEGGSGTHRPLHLHAGGFTEAVVIGIDGNVNMSGCLFVGDDLDVADSLTVDGVLSTRDITSPTGTVDFDNDHITTAGSLTVKQITASYIPGASTFSEATIVVNPATATAEYMLQSWNVGGVNKAKIDAEGDAFFNELDTIGDATIGGTIVLGSDSLVDGTWTSEGVILSNKIIAGTTTDPNTSSKLFVCNSVGGDADTFDGAAFIGVPSRASVPGDFGGHIILGQSDGVLTNEGQGVAIAARQTGASPTQVGLYFYTNPGGGADRSVACFWAHNNNMFPQGSIISAFQIKTSGELEGGSLDINGNGDISGTLNVATGDINIQAGNLFVFDTIDLGTNEITDGQFVGNWDYNSGDLTGIKDLTATGLGTFAGVTVADGDLTFTGTAGFYPRLIRQDAEPANGTGATQIDDEEQIIWIDTNDSNRVYLMYNDNTNTNIVKVELA